MAPLSILGRWDEMIAVAVPLLDSYDELSAVYSTSALAEVAVARDDQALMSRCRELAAPHRDAPYVDLRSAAQVTLALASLDRGAWPEAFALARPVLPMRPR